MALRHLRAEDMNQSGGEDACLMRKEGYPSGKDVSRRHGKKPDNGKPDGRCGAEGSDDATAVTRRGSAVV